MECPNQIKQQATENSVPVKHYNVIYKLIDALKEDINERLPPKQVEDVVGEAKVLEQFLINEGKRKVPVAGCRCEKGILKKNLKYRVVRNNETIHEGRLFL